MADILNYNSLSKVAIRVSDSITGKYVDDGTASFTVFEALDADEIAAWNTPERVDVLTLSAVTGASGISMTFSADGKYVGIVTKTVGDSLTLGDQHPVRITFTKSGETTTTTRLYIVDYNKGESAP